MTATHGIGVYGNAVGVTTPLDMKMDQLGLFVKTAPNTIRPGIFWDGNATVVSGKANMSYDVRAFSAVLSRGATAGAVPLANDAVYNVVTTAAPGSNSRYDVVYLWQREFSIDGTDSNPVIGVIQGTAAASPTVPALTSFPGAIALAQILVPAGVTATNSGTTITQTAPFTTVAGGTFVVRNSTELAALPTVTQGTQVVQLDNGVTWRWYDLFNGSTNPTGRKTAGWKPWNTSVPVSYWAAGQLTNFTVGSGGTPLLTWVARAGQIKVQLTLTIVSGSSWSAATALLLPFAAADAYGTSTGPQHALGRGAYLHPAVTAWDLAVTLSAGTLDRVTPNTVNTAGALGVFASAVSNTVPEATAIGNTLSLTFEYDPA